MTQTPSHSLRSQLDEVAKIESKLWDKIELSFTEMSEEKRKLLEM